MTEKRCCDCAHAIAISTAIMGEFWACNHPQALRTGPHRALRSCHVNRESPKTPGRQSTLCGSEARHFLAKGGDLLRDASEGFGDGLQRRGLQDGQSNLQPGVG